MRAMLRVPAALLCDAGVVKLADARDSKSRFPKGSEGSTPSSGTKTLNDPGSLELLVGRPLRLDHLFPDASFNMRDRPLAVDR